MNPPNTFSSPTVPPDFALLGQFLTQDHWDPQQLEGKEIYRIGFSGQNGHMTCYAFIPEDLRQLVFYAVASVTVAEAKRQLNSVLEQGLLPSEALALIERD
jgi:hypothetical protein